MANPFKEAAKVQKKAPGGKQEPAVEVKEVVRVEIPAEQEKPAETPVEAVTVKEEKPAAKKAEKKEEKPAKKNEDLFAGLQKSEKPSVNTYGFYLTDENVKKLKALASKKGVSASKLLDHILSEIL